MARAAAFVAAVIPFLPLAPPAPKLAGLPPCTPAGLRASTSLQGATGSMLGGFTLRNTGGRACVLDRPVLLRRDDDGPLDRLGGPTPLGLRRIRLDPGHAAVVELQLWNACGAPTNAHLLVVLPNGDVDLGIGPGGRCDLPTAPPRYALGAMDDGDPPVLTPTERRQHAALRVTDLVVPARTRAGTALVYTVSVRNRSRAAVRCPLFAEQVFLWKQDVVLTRQYRLNCTQLGARSVTRFEMKIDLPRDARGDASVEWGLEDRVAPVPVRASIDAVLNSPVDVGPYSWLPFDRLVVS